MIFEFNKLSEVSIVPGAVYKGGDNKTPTKDDPLSKIFIIDGCKKAIGNMGGFRKTSKERDGKVIRGTIAFVVAVDGGKQSEWPNLYNEETGIFTYYGDNRIPGNDIFNTKNKGNKLLYDMFRNAYSMSPEDRSKIPPIFIFKSTGNGCDKQFIGLAVPGIKGKGMDESLKKKVFEGKEGHFENYEANFTVLELDSGVIERDWLKDLKDIESKVSYVAPKEWNNFILNGLNNIKYNQSYEEIEVKEEVYENYNNEIERKIKVRVTQGKFRDSLLKRDKKCVICGLDIESLLVASHIKPWSKADEFEKQDENNGLLLCVNHDALFDRGYISFDDNGEIIISDKIPKNTFEKLNINNKIQLNLNKKQLIYMNYHKNTILKR